MNIVIKLYLKYEKKENFNYHIMCNNSDTMLKLKEKLVTEIQHDQKTCLTFGYQRLRLILDGKEASNDTKLVNIKQNKNLMFIAIAPEYHLFPNDYLVKTEMLGGGFLLALCAQKRVSQQQALNNAILNGTPALIELKNSNFTLVYFNGKNWKLSNEIERNDFFAYLSPPLQTFLQRKDFHKNGQHIKIESVHDINIMQSLWGHLSKNLLPFDSIVMLERVNKMTGYLIGIEDKPSGIDQYYYINSLHTLIMLKKCPLTRYTGLFEFVKLSNLPQYMINKLPTAGNGKYSTVKKLLNGLLDTYYKKAEFPLLSKYSKTIQSLITDKVCAIDEIDSALLSPTGSEIFYAIHLGQAPHLLAAIRNRTLSLQRIAALQDCYYFGVYHYFHHHHQSANLQRFAAETGIGFEHIVKLNKHCVTLFIDIFNNNHYFWCKQPTKIDIVTSYFKNQQIFFPPLSSCFTFDVQCLYAYCEDSAGGARLRTLVETTNLNASDIIWTTYSDNKGEIVQQSGKSELFRAIYAGTANHILTAIEKGVISKKSIIEGSLDEINKILKKSPKPIKQNSSKDNKKEYKSKKTISPLFINSLAVKSNNDFINENDNNMEQAQYSSLNLQL